MKIKLQFITIFIIIFIFSYIFTPVFAWGPISHCGLISNAISDPTLINGLAKRLITEQTRYFWEGVMFPDITVLHYYTSFDLYGNTHEWSFYNRLWTAADGTLQSDQARAFALGVGTHLIQDAIIHNGYIPDKIKQYLTQNSILHPIIEADIEGLFLSGGRWYTFESQTRAQNAFISVDQPFTDPRAITYLELDGEKRPIDFAIQKGLLFTNVTSSEYLGYVKDAHDLVGFLGTPDFYGTGYVISPELWGIYQAAGSVIKNFVSISDIEPFYNSTWKSTVNWWNHEENIGHPEEYVNSPTGSTKPSGSVSLNEANFYVTTWFIVIIVAIFTIGGFYIYYKKTKKTIPIPMLDNI